MNKTVVKIVIGVVAAGVTGVGGYFGYCWYKRRKQAKADNAPLEVEHISYKTEWTKPEQEQKTVVRDEDDCWHKQTDICKDKFARQVSAYVQTEGEKENFRLKYIAGGPLSTAELSINEARQEIVNFGRICYKGFIHIREAIDAHMTDSENEKIDMLVKYEEITDNIEYEIATYLNEVTKGEISDSSAARRLLGSSSAATISAQAVSRSPSAS